MKVRIIVVLSLLTYLYGCGSTSTVSTDMQLEDGFDSISNKDFARVKEVPYKDYQDIFDESIVNNDSLVKESIARLPKPRLEYISNKVNNPISKGVSLCYQKRYKAAFLLLDKIYSKYKSHPSYWNQLGTCYFLKGEKKKAFLYYNKARDINTNYVPAINNHGVIHQKNGDMQGAQLAYEKAAKLNSFFMTPLFNLGQLYLRYGLIKKAKEIFKTLLNKNSRDPDAINGLATAYFLLGDNSSAIAYWKSLDSEMLGRPYVGINYAVALKMVGKAYLAEDIIEDINTKRLGELTYYFKKAKLYIGVR